MGHSLFCRHWLAKTAIKARDVYSWNTPQCHDLYITYIGDHVTFYSHNKQSGVAKVGFVVL